MVQDELWNTAETLLKQLFIEQLKKKAAQEASNNVF
jgi:hypothetical protein